MTRVPPSPTGNPEAATFAVVDLRHHPEHAAAVAAWVHREWWSGSAVSLAALTEWAEGCAASNGFPGVLVAVSQGRAIGSVFLHGTEAEDRPAFTPYLGALYVEPSWRRQGVGRALVQAVERHAAGLGFDRLYLNAVPSRTSFYEPLGWKVVERAYGPHRLNIMRRALPAMRPSLQAP
ncbi:MAG TPA: GNAT family N-acetyltransferase [Beijerinckiaceae bacterium]|jgi:GNAT superfamily N-acetyltransferase